MSDEQTAKLRLEIAHVLFIDIVGYSKLLIDEQSQALRELNGVVRNSEAVHDAEAAGQLLRLPTGDGMALVFTGSAEAPVEGALQIAEALREKTSLPVRMGIHSGPVHHVGDVNERANIAGAGINIAQRVMDCGDAGHILLSRRVADDLEPYRHWRACLHDIGECDVKHGLRLHIVNLYTDKVGNPLTPQKLNRFGARIIRGARSQAARRVWPVVAVAGLSILVIITVLLAWINRTGAPKSKMLPSPSLLASVAEKGIAVLPFENLSHDPENAYLADGIQEEILTRLANVSDLKVISRTSASKFRSSPDNLRDIAAKLGVANVLEGSVQKSADQLRVNVQLINATTDAHLWADTYDRKLTDVFVIESEIAKAIADKLKARLSGREEQAISTRPTENSEAHQFYLKGRYFWNKRTSEGLKTAITYFNQAIEKDPGYGPAYAGLADAYAILPNYSQTPGKEAYPKAEAAALKALELDDELAEAHISLANVRLWHKWGKEAEAEFKRGLQLNPNYSTGHQWYSIYLSVMGRLEESIAEMEKAKELDPFSIIINTETGCPYLYSKQYERATEYFTKAVEMDPDFPFAHFALAEAYDRVGRYKEAVEEHEKALALARRSQAFDATRNDAPKAWYALTGPLQNAHRSLGPQNYWQSRLQSALKLYEQGSAPATEVAGIYSILGDREQALDWLEKAYREADDFLVFLNIQPQFESLRSDFRFQALVQRVLPSSPSAAAKSPSRSDKSVAVLPFQNLSRDEENSFFTDGIREEILTRLSKIADLKVVSCASTERFRSAPDDFPAIAYQLGVATLLKGTVQRSGDEVRINVQLIKAADNAQLWAETFDHKLTDIFNIESDVASAVAATLKAKLTGREQHSMADQPTQSTEAHQLHLKGRFFWNKRTADDVEKAVDYFKQATIADPNYALAYAGLADAYLLLPGLGKCTPQDCYPKAKAAANKALELDQTLTEAHTSLGCLLGYYDFDYARARREFERAIELNPNYATAHQWYGDTVLVPLGRFEQAIAQHKQALELDPLSLIIHVDLSNAYRCSRRVEEARQVLRRALEIDPNFYFAHRHLGLMLEMEGKFQEAITEYHKSQAANADPRILALLAHANARSGNRSEALRLLSELEARSTGGYVSAYNFAIAYLGLGENDKAFAALEQGYADRAGSEMGRLKVEPLWDPVRSDARFNRLLSRIFSSPRAISSPLPQP